MLHPTIIPSRHLVLACLCRDVYSTWNRRNHGIEWMVVQALIDGRLTWVFVFCGSKDLRDWLINLRVLPWYFMGLGICPIGYIRKAKQLRTNVLVAAQRLGIDLTEAIFVGHSLGGNMAQGVAASLATQGIYVREVMTCGAPEIGPLHALADNVDEITLYINGNDLVPQILPYSTPVPLSHIGDAPGFDHLMGPYIFEMEKLAE